jgi:integrase/recombinase XerC
MIDSFINYLEYEKRSSPHTVLAYRKDLEQAAEFVDLSFEIKELHQSSHSELRAWVIDLVEQGLSTTSVNRKIATLRSFFKFLLRSRVVTQDPTYDRVRIRRERL